MNVNVFFLSSFYFIGSDTKCYVSRIFSSTDVHSFKHGFEIVKHINGLMVVPCLFVGAH